MEICGNYFKWFYHENEALRNSSFFLKKWSLQKKFFIKDFFNKCDKHHEF